MSKKEKISVFKITIKNKNCYLFFDNDKKKILTEIERLSRKAYDENKKTFTLANAEIPLSLISKTLVNRTKAAVLKVNVVNNKIKSLVHLDKSVIKIKQLNSLINEPQKARDSISKQMTVFNIMKDTDTITNSTEIKTKAPELDEKEVYTQIVRLCSANVLELYYKLDKEIAPKNDPNDWSMSLDEVVQKAPSHIDRADLLKQILVGFKWVSNTSEEK